MCTLKINKLCSEPYSTKSVEFARSCRDNVIIESSANRNVDYCTASNLNKKIKAVVKDSTCSMPKITKAASNSDEINKAHDVQKPSMDKSSTNDVNETHLTQEFTQRCNLILPLPMIGLHESKHTKSISSALSNQIETEISVKKIW